MSARRSGRTRSMHNYADMHRNGLGFTANANVNVANVIYGSDSRPARDGEKALDQVQQLEEEIRSVSREVDEQSKALIERTRSLRRGGFQR